jgi:hypothetical protein
LTERRGQRDKDAPFFRHLAQRAKGEPLPREQDPSWLLQQAKDRLAAANAAIGSTRTFFFALISIAAYIGVVVWGTTNEQLLRISPVKLPIIGVEVPLTGFYAAVPWLFVLLHFNLIIHLGLTSKKLKAFLDQLAELANGPPTICGMTSPTSRWRSGWRESTICCSAVFWWSWSGSRWCCSLRSCCCGWRFAFWHSRMSCSLGCKRRQSQRMCS